MNSEKAEERRRFHRILFDAKTTLAHGGKDFRTEAEDVSLNGALVKRPEGWNGVVGDDVTISIQLDDEQTITMQTIVAHAETEHLGLRCHHIDMDSITHLRRLVELNLGDTELLERELEALG
jgi:hypothetical protein